MQKKQKLNKRRMFSVIVPVLKINDYISKELLPSLAKQTYKEFEVIIVVDELSERDKKLNKKYKYSLRIIRTNEKGPAKKRDLGANLAKGEILAFIDDDAYPDRQWLENALLNFNDLKIAAVGGPGLTPRNNCWQQQVSGWMWSSWLGAGGAGTYRCFPGKKQLVDDYPTFNLLIRKKDFEKLGGFNSRFYPGEDTKLCHDIVYKLRKKIIYDPKVIVHHHRRKIFKKHLKQLGRYGFHRGFFVKILPKTSRRLGYFLPSLFTLGLLFSPFIIIFLRFLKLQLLSHIFSLIYFCTISFYILLLLITGFWVTIKSKKIIVGLFVIPTILVSHIYYGIRFIKGLLSSKLY